MCPDSALLFDLDGTLVDTWEANYCSYRDSLATIGRGLKRTAFTSHVGGHWREFLPLLAGTMDMVLLTELHHRKQEIYPHYLNTVRLNLPLVALLRTARPAWATGLVTSASRANVDLLLGHFQLEVAFDHIVTGDDVPLPKPAPDGYVRCLRELGACAATSLAFEDSSCGITAARTAGLQVLTVGSFASM